MWKPVNFWGVMGGGRGGGAESTSSEEMRQDGERSHASPAMDPFLTSDLRPPAPVTTSSGSGCPSPGYVTQLLTNTLAHPWNPDMERCGGGASEEESRMGIKCATGDGMSISHLQLITVRRKQDVPRNMVSNKVRKANSSANGAGKNYDSTRHEEIILINMGEA